MNTRHDVLRKGDRAFQAGRENGFATALEAAQFLRLSTAMIRKMIAEGTCPARRFGTAVRIPWAWLEAQAQAATRCEP
jgi:excisionase family DNA binding protein